MESKFDSESCKECGFYKECLRKRLDNLATIQMAEAMAEMPVLDDEQCYLFVSEEKMAEIYQDEFDLIDQIGILNDLLFDILNKKKVTVRDVLMTIRNADDLCDEVMDKIDDNEEAEEV